VYSFSSPKLTRRAFAFIIMALPAASCSPFGLLVSLGVVLYLIPTKRSP
jgi:hypothetical protein